ncbi:hypothetical protein POM88_027428 [Heracleum sosnowskyi]|uniref:Uncharacterized protein n=1 Tax=Heracleum sosnowskyi TaxID=360622 RepID=A0AAD8I8Y8_9APIA|nr:hypothetical protein POM88_027428 [Heracleum sosnowskyi]
MFSNPQQSFHNEGVEDFEHKHALTESLVQANSTLMVQEARVTSTMGGLKRTPCGRVVTMLVKILENGNRLGPASDDEPFHTQRELNDNSGSIVVVHYGQGNSGGESGCYCGRPNVVFDSDHVDHEEHEEFY